jgi:endoplasmic reticulum-Golgi intermediate compartment protein 2
LTSVLRFIAITQNLQFLQDFQGYAEYSETQWPYQLLHVSLLKETIASMAQLNGGFEKLGLDEDAFGEKSALANLRTFDAFPKTKPTYTTTTSAGGLTTLILAALCALLTITELLTWSRGTESHHFSVERGVSHELQLNLDIVVAMHCSDLHVNVQDAAMDRIMAGDLLKKDDTIFSLWDNSRKNKNRRGNHATYPQVDANRLNSGNAARKRAEEEDTHVSHVLGHMRDNPSKKFEKTPRLKRWENADACRIYGSLEGNKVQGDFHITARGHGYMEFGGAAHLQHANFNFSHQINELSFGPHYPGILNPLDKTGDSTPANFHKFQYFVSIVPTIFTSRKVSTSNGALDPRLVPQPPTLDMTPHEKVDKEGRVVHVPVKSSKKDHRSIFTNQYAATSQSREVASNTIPGIFFKYDIEPILLIVSASKTSFLALCVRLVNVISGILVGGGWCFQLWMWMSESGLVKLGRRGMNRRTSGFIGEKGDL